MFTLRLITLWLLAVLAGCSGSEELHLADYLDGLDLETPAELRAEVPVGEYAIPIALRGDAAVEWRLLKFKLFAVTSPEEEKAVESAWERRKGQFQDEVLTICRSISADELEDPRLAALKARLVDMARALLGETRLHQLSIVAATIEAI